MKLPISQRLLACCDYVNQGDRIADIGCDHGYLSIHLVTDGIAQSAIASDVNELPLQSAVRNAAKYGVSDKIRFFLSDGVRNIPRDFDTLICAGMGADTMISILEAAPWLRSNRYRMILQCQSKRPQLRRYLYENGWRINRETLVKEGKFYYPITEVVYDPGHSLTPGGYYITPALLRSGSPLLPDFLERVITGLQCSVDGMAQTGGEKYEELKTVLTELQQFQ
jgi:tRNA (adenine22-N1)-methyltransferase